MSRLGEGADSRMYPRGAAERVRSSEWMEMGFGKQGMEWLPPGAMIRMGGIRAARSRGSGVLEAASAGYGGCKPPPRWVGLFRPIHCRIAL